MPIHTAFDSMKNTTLEQKASNADCAETLKNSLDQENTSACAHGRPMRSLSGESSETQADKLESTAQCSETKASIEAQTLSDRLMPSLISAGLVCGIIPTSMRSAYGQLTLDSVLRPQVGPNAEEQKEVL